MTEALSASPVGAYDRATKHRLGGPRRVAERTASDDAVLAGEVRKLAERYRNDVLQQIDLAEKLQSEFERNSAQYPVTRRTAATELLRAYAKLKDFEKKATRDRSGRLLMKTPFDPTPRLWTRKGPHNVEEIQPFSPANISRWKKFGDSASLAAARPPVSQKPRSVILPAKDPPLAYMTIKIPGMTLANPDGRARILAAVIRLASGQAIKEDAAYRIAARIDLLNYLVLDFEDTIEHATTVYDSLPLGWTRGVKLRREFLSDLQKQTSLALTANPRYWSEGNGFAQEYMQQFSAEERTWYVIGRLAKKPSKDLRSGYTPGQFVNADGIMFVGPEVNVSLFYTPDGRLFGVPEKQVRDQQLGAIIQGAKWARGGVILGYGIVAVGAVALAAPALLSFAAQTLATAIAAPAATVTGIVEGITYTRYFVWLTLNWQAAFAWGSAGVGLGIKLLNFSPSEFIEEFKESPKDALINLGRSLVETMHDFAEAYTSTPSLGGGGRTRDRTPTRPPSKTNLLPDTGVPDSSPALTVPKAPTNPPMTAATPGDSDELVLQRMTTNAKIKSKTTPANDDNQHVVELPQAEAKNDQIELMGQRTGTDDQPSSVPARTAPGGVTYRPSASRPPVSPDKGFSKAVAAAQGKVTNPRATPNRSTGPGTHSTPPVSSVRPIRMSPAAASAAGLTDRMKSFVERAATIFKAELSRISDKIPPWARSTTAHTNTLKQLRKEFPDVTEHGEPLTGVTGPTSTKGQPNVRVSDATYVDPKSPARATTPADVNVELKLKAYPDKGGRVLVASGGNDPKVTSDQIQAYEVSQTQLGVPVFVVNGTTGKIYAFSGGRWIEVGGPE